MEEHERTLLKWLESHGPDDWHQVAIDWNWDAGLDILTWIAEQPRCDRATAQHLIIGGGADAYHGISSREDLMAQQPYAFEPFDLVSTAITNWNAGFYTRSEVASHDPNQIKRSQHRYRKAIEANVFPWSLNDDLFQILSGRHFSYRYTEGWPPEVEADLQARGINY